MMTVDQYCLQKIAEECNEIAIECSKIMQFGTHSYSPADPQQTTNVQKLRSELNDLLGTLEFAKEQCGFEFIPNDYAIAKKKEKLLKYMSISRELGYVAYQ